MFHVKHEIEDWQEGGFGLYLHWPFCESKCPYCDFNSHVASQVDQARWCRAYLTEIDRVGELTVGRVLQTVFFGGGTPSLMQAETVHAILDRVRRTWRTSNAIEITLEANPRSIEADRFAAYRDAGVNRVSIGIQSLREGPLKQLGRLHSVAEARAALETANRVFDRVSFDLIYARQGQMLADWREELTEALAMAKDHLSLYQLTIEPGTAFGDRLSAGKLAGLPSELLAADMYDLTQTLCDQAGMPAYEVSNHARPGSESRHNRIYWTGGDFAGIGPGAHGRLTLHGQRIATEALRAPTAWLQAIEGGQDTESRTTLDPTEQATEYLLMGLRVTEGISLRRLSRLVGRSFPGSAAQDLIASGHLCHEGDRLRTTPLGRILLNAVLRHLADDL